MNTDNSLKNLIHDNREQAAVKSINKMELNANKTYYSGLEE